MSVKRAILWLVIALPSVGIIYSIYTGQQTSHEMLHPSGELSIRFMIVAMMAGPLNDAFGPNRFFRGWLSIRRNLGVAAFIYALIHLVLYVIDLASVSKIVGEALVPSILTGWIGTALMLAAAATSFDRVMVSMGRRWKTIQRLVYPALALSVLHWGLLHEDFIPALVHISPLLLAWVARGWAKLYRGKAASIA